MATGRGLTGQKAQRGALATWFDVTIYESALKRAGKTRRWLERYCKQDIVEKAAYVLERGDRRGKRHYQVRIKFYSGRKTEEVERDFFTVCGEVSITHVRDFKYVTKRGFLRIFKSWNIIPDFIRKNKPFPWQKTIIESRYNINDRFVNLLIDPDGNSGKSWLCRYIDQYDLGVNVVPQDSVKDVMRQVMQRSKRDLYVLDITRSDQRINDPRFWKIVEDLKNGFVYDDRYTFDYEWLEVQPSVWIFCNRGPDPSKLLSMLSNDRWHLWIFDKEQNMRRIESDEYLELKHLYS